MSDLNLCFPVWDYAHLADPYMASIRRIRKICVNDPEREAVLIGSVFHMARIAGWPLERLTHAAGLQSEAGPLPEAPHA